MSDKGFDVQDILAPYDITVNIPTFFSKRNRLNNKTVLHDRKIASKRVHVERFIGLAKNNKNTIKVLAGVTPGGLCSYISPAYGGSTSDRQIVERTLPSMCDPGDSVMSDKGFDVQDILAPYDITVNIPTFFSKRNRLNNKTVLHDRKIASKRVHVERFIGLAKIYTILSSPLNTSETILSSDIIFVCFMLCNFLSGIVNKDA